MKQIETERLILRRFVEEDRMDLYEYLSDEDVVHYEPYGVFTEEACRIEASNRAKNDAFWAVCLKNGKLIGNLFLGKLAFGTYELGFVFNRVYQSKGYAFESAGALLDYAFNELGARRIVAMCNPLNTSSWKLLERLKMRREGHLIQNVYFKRDKNGEPLWQDTYEYAILIDEWQKN